MGGDSLASTRNTPVKMSHYCGQGCVDNVTILMAPIRLQYLLHVVCVLGKVHVQYYIKIDIQWHCQVK